uniref:uncharacterized protein LOC120339059 isoform X1 n=1 Tax=Styela clava TaxID=7725 RepID=UPI00193A75A2|nr:uncharacterized protein LOC120339059 isoform X1 [Styela clava]
MFSIWKYHCTNNNKMLSSRQNYFKKNMKSLLLLVLSLYTCLQPITSKEVTGKVDDTIDKPPGMGEQCTCSWSKWMDGSIPDENGEDETYTTLRKKGNQFCKSPVDIQCYNYATTSENIGFSTVCNVNLGLSCSLLCDDYAVRVACCYCPPEATGPEFQIYSSISSGGCLKAIPSTSAGLTSSVTIVDSCDLSDSAQSWVWVAKYTLKNIKTQQCLAVKNNTIVLENCELEENTQKWKYLSRSSLLQKYGSTYKYMKRQGNTAVLDTSRGTESKWLSRVKEGTTSMKNMRNFQCLALSPMENGDMTCTLGRYVSSECTFTCDYGYRLSEDIENPSECTDDGLFTAETPKCEKILCGPPMTEVEHGTVTCSNENSLDSSCIFKCDTGYALRGQQQLMCMENSKWNDNAPKCEKIICDPDLEKEGLQDGTVNCTNNAFYGSKCTYTCLQGFELLGPAIRICQLNEEWDETRPVCEKIQCPAIGANENSAVSCSAGIDFQSVCKFTCDTGYTMVGSASSVCTADKTWGSEPPTCERKTCNIPAIPENGQKICDDGNFYGSKCSFSCDRGFQLEGQGSLTCTDSGWDVGVPKCTQISCNRQVNPANGAVTCTNNELYGSTCSFLCSHGFKLKGSDSTQCINEGEWSNPTPVCERVTCPLLTEVRNGNVFCSQDNFFNSACLVLCDTGYAMPPGTQPVPVNCQLNGLWSSTPATCKPIQCRGISIHRGLIACTESNNYNSTCTFQCKEGYNLLGTTKAKCTETGWDAQAPSCSRQTCSPPLARPSNGQITCQTSGRPVCTFSCNPGYKLIGSKTSECQRDETWSVTEIPICKIGKCPSLPTVPDHGNVTCTKDTIYDSLCTFDCEKGYKLVGEKQTRCTESTTWSQESPVCEKISCPMDDTPPHSNVKCTDKNFYKSRCTYKCEVGYKLLGSSNIQCYHNSTWSDPTPYCERITCSPSYSNPSNGKVICSDVNNYNSNCDFSCEEGFSLEGDKVSTCLTTGWTMKSQPMCKKITCPMDDEGIPNGSKECDRANDYKSTCKFSCNHGYELIGSKKVVCTKKGSWSSEKPRCKETKCPEIPPIDNGQVICIKNNMYDSECKFVCNDGYMRKPDTSTVKCMENRRWNPAGFPICEPVNKTLPTLPPTTKSTTTTTTKPTTQPTTTTSTTTTTTMTTTMEEETSPEPEMSTPFKIVTKAPFNQEGKTKPVTPKILTTAPMEIPPNENVVSTKPDKNDVTFSENNVGEQEGAFPIIIVAVVVAVVALLVVIVVALVLWRKRSKKTSKYNNGPTAPFKMDNRYDHEMGPLIPNGNTTGTKKYGAISMDRLEMEYNRRHADDDKMFREEYHSLVDGTGSREAGGRAKNKDKNRYTNILPYDHSRVILPKQGMDGDSDYINASFVDGYKHKGKFIAAQGPKENTIVDFWRMVWEQNVSTVIMATNTEERKEPKCAKYWPSGEPQSYGDLMVENLGENHLVDYTIRSFSAQRAQGDSTMSIKRTITQYHFTSWPDFGVPKSPSGILKFLRKIKHSSPTGYGPIIVHCSAGVGRTGTFICIDAMMDMISRENKIDVFACCSQMRQQRPEMVQTEQQYIFIYQAVLEHHLYGDTEVEATEVSGHIDDLMQRLPGNVTGMEHEFKKLTSIRIQKEHMRAGNHPANMRKNRVLLILPYDWNRVMLPIKRGQENTDYINASYIDGYRQKDAYIATQGPLPHTMEDFWRMIWDSKSASIVMLTELVERGQAKCAQYWPNDGTLTFGDIEVEFLSVNESEDYSERDFQVSNKSNTKGGQLIVKQFHYHGWPEVGAPVSGYSMIELVEDVQKQQQNSGNHPIVIHCSAGAGRTGAFCALTTALEQVKAEGVLDMFQIVKCLRMQRPHMVQNLEQYEFCYRAVQEYIDSMSEYYNFK